METTSYKTIELSQEELYEIEGGSLSEVAYKIWSFLGFCCILNSRVMAENDRYRENFYNH
jgi:hypothetical protein